MALLASVKNKMKRKEMLDLLAFIIQSTQSATGFCFVPVSEANALLKADAELITVDDTVKNNEGQVKAFATAKGIEAFNASQAPAENAPAELPLSDEPIVSADPSPAPSKIEIVTLTEMPGINRGGVKAEQYPFEELKPFPQPGNSFFVPASETRPNPAKTLASTVASATKRYKSKDGRVFSVRKAADESGKITGAYVIRTK